MFQNKLAGLYHLPYHHVPATMTRRRSTTQGFEITGRSLSSQTSEGLASDIALPTLFCTRDINAARQWITNGEGSKRLHYMYIVWRRVRENPNRLGGSDNSRGCTRRLFCEKWRHGVPWFFARQMTRESLKWIRIPYFQPRGRFRWSGMSPHVYIYI